MTITVTDLEAGPFVATGALQVVPYDFMTLGDDEIEVVVADVVVNPALYTVDRNTLPNGEADEGGSVSISAAALGVGASFFLRAAPKPLQPQVWSDSGSRLRNLNEALDRLTLLALAGSTETAELSAYLAAAIAEAGSAIGLIGKVDRDGENVDPDFLENLPFFASGAGATALSLQTFLRSLGASPLGFGAAGNGVADDTVALQAAFDSGHLCVDLGEGFTYKITNTVIIPDGVSAVFNSSKIVYSGPRNRTAVQFGEGGASAQEADLRGAWITSETTDISSDAFVGLKVYNAQRNLIDIARISGFTRNVEFVSRGQGVTGMRLQARFLGTCKYALTTTCDGSAFNYINSNTFEIEEWTNVTTLAGNTHGWHARGIAGAFTVENQNGNFIHFHGIQPGAGVGGETRNAALIEGVAGNNIIQIDRIEAARGAIATVSGPVGNGVAAEPVVSLNKFRLGLVTSGGGDIQNVITETGSARVNTIEWMNEQAYQAEDSVTDLVKKVKSYNSGNFTVMGGAHMTVGDGVPRVAQSFGGIETDRDHVRLSGTDRSIGRFIDIEGGETFMMWATTHPSAKALLGVAPYDADGARLATVMPGSPLIISDPETDTYNRWSSNMGGCYQTGSPVSYWFFRTDPTVKRLRYFVQSGRVQAFGIRRISPGVGPLSGYSGLEASDLVHYIGGNPTGGTVGIYGRGDVALADTASGAGLDGYQYTLGGRYAPVWVISTAYALGQLRTNGGNVYEVTTAGVSAGAGGPSGTGVGIADGSVVWRYVSPLAVATAI